MIIKGDGPERKILEQLSNKLGIKQYIRFEGASPHNVGNPLLEAMMRGKCIVTLNNGDTGRFI